MDTFSKRTLGPFSVENSKLLALREGLQFTVEVGITLTKVECDASRIGLGLSKIRL